MLITFILELIAIATACVTKRKLWIIISIILFFILLVQFVVIKFLPGTDYWPM